MPSVGQIAGAIAPTAASIGTAAGVGSGTLLGMSAGPAGAVVGAAVGALLMAINAIGQGRKTANKMTQNGGPQDILNKQLAAIVKDPATNAQEKGQATDVAYQQFLQASNQFAQTQGSRASQVVQQAIYKTPGLQSTLNSLLAPINKSAWDQSYTSLVPGITATSSVNTSSIPWGSIAGTAAGIAAPFALQALQGNTVGNIASNPGATQGLPQYDENGNIIAGTASLPNAGTMTGNGSSGGGILGTLGNILGGGGSNNSNSSLLSRILPNLISSGTSLLGGVIGSNAAQSAAGTQANASLQAAQLQAQAGQNAIDFNKQALAQQQQNIQPWLTAGGGALNSIQNIVNNPGFAWNQTFTAPTAAEAMQDPGIQFQLQEGEKALSEYERANGALHSGKAVKDINSYAQGVASEGYQNVYNRSLSNYNTNYGTFANERLAQLNPQLSLAGLGQVSASGLNSNIGQTGNTIGNITQNTAAQVGNQNTNAAAANAAGTVGSANAISGALGNVANNILNLGGSNIQQIISQLQNSGYAVTKKG